MVKDKYKRIVEKHFADAQAKFKHLALFFTEDGARVYGKLEFAATRNGVHISDSYDIEIFLSSDYPESPPVAKESGGKIPDDFHKFEGGQLCLATPWETRLQFLRQPDILGFIKNLLVPYLYTYSHKLNYYYLPYGELPHGDRGLEESYRGLLDGYKVRFNIESDIDVLRLLKILAENSYKGHLKCPCGSGKDIGNCHGVYLLKLKKKFTKKHFLKEYINFIPLLFPGINDAPNDLLSKKIISGLRKILKD